MNISTWLAKIKLEQYAPQFVEHGIFLKLLPDLTDSDLRDIGVDKVGNRKVILAYASMPQHTHEIFDPASIENEYAEKLEKRADSTREWIECAQYYMKTWNDNERAKRCLQTAETSYGEFSDLVSLAKAWHYDLLNDEEAERLVRAAELLAKNAIQMAEVASCHLQLLKNREQALNLLNEAESRAEETDDWIDCKGVYDELEENQQGVKCLENAKKVACNTQDWLSITGEYLCSGQSDLAEKYLRKAESVADDYEEWIECAGYWMGEDWAGINEFWVISFANQKEAYKCLEQAYKLREGIEDLVSCATEFHRLLGEDHAAGQLLEEAQEEAQEVSEYLLCAQGWREIGVLAKGVKCLREAESIGRKSQDDLMEVAWEWEKYGRSEEAERIKRRIEGLEKD